MMKAIVLKGLGPLSADSTPLVLEDIPAPLPGEDEILVRVTACGVCHTELDEIEGRLPPRKLPIVLGHQIVGVVEGVNDRATRSSSVIQAGQRVGISWIHSACGTCEYCISGRENLCPAFRATGRDVDGGYAQYTTIDPKFAFPIPEQMPDEVAAPLLCAGAIGYRSMVLAGAEGERIVGLMGFGASAHLVLKMIRHSRPASPVFVFSRNAEEREFARDLGAAWAGAITDDPPEQMDAVIDTTPAWQPVLQALLHLKPGGRLIINAIRKQGDDSALLGNLDYASQLWLEKSVKSVANVTRADVRDCLALAAAAQIRPEVQLFELGEANSALLQLKRGRIRGAKVLRI